MTISNRYNTTIKEAPSKEEEKVIDLSFSKNSFIQGIIFAEILGKPKAKRGRRRGGGRVGVKGINCR
jgi:hypothetical protein